MSDSSSAPAPAGPHVDAEDGDDVPSVEREAKAFARIIGSRHTVAPLSVGLFGDWGSGKSFFMGLMQREVQARAEAFERVASRLDDDGDREGRAALDRRWHGRIAQITFNAWDYAEPNLWASLVTRVFDALAEQLNPEESVAQTRARLLAEVSEGKQRREQAQLELDQAAELLVEARTERERCEAELAALRDQLAVVEVVSPPAASASAEAAAPSEQLHVAGAWPKLRVTLRWVWSRGRATKIALVVALLMVLAGLLLALAWWRAWLDLSPQIATALTVTGIVVAVADTLGAWVTKIGPRIRAANEAFTEGKAAADRFLDRAARDLLGPGQGAAALARRRFEAAQVELDSAQLAAAQATEAVARTRQQLHRLRGGRRFYDFIDDRDQSDDYRQHLGLVSLIREDFERLEQILQQIEREGPGEGGTPAPISRIVLYIDDLDRCEPQRVVEVLQAIHLLLATPVFVVVVAADVRWLRRSLTLHYDRLLGTRREDLGHEDGTTPESYLEKIFQIPFSLRPMGTQGFSALVQSLVHSDLEPSTSDSKSTPQEHGPTTPSPLEQELTRDAALSLAPDEIAFMQLLRAVIDAPRLAKTLVNTYRLLRAELTPTELNTYLDEQRYREVMILLAIQIGRPQEAAILFDQLLGAPPPELAHVLTTLAEHHSLAKRWSQLHVAVTQVVPTRAWNHDLRAWIDRIRRFSFAPTNPDK